MFFSTSSLPALSDENDEITNRNSFSKEILLQLDEASQGYLISAQVKQNQLISSMTLYVDFSH